MMRLIAIFGSLVAVVSADDTAIQSARTFLQEHCIRCHGEKKQKGQVRLDTMSWDVQDEDTAQRWQDVLDQLHSGDMPPWDEEQPNDADLQRMLSTLGSHLELAREQLADHRGEIKMRRLNRREYSNSLHSLLGLRPEEANIPEDIESENFDTVGNDQFFTSHNFEEYLETARVVSRRALHWMQQPHQKVKVQRHDRARAVLEKHEEAAVLGERRLLQQERGEDWKAMGFAELGAKNLYFRQYWLWAKLPRLYTQLPLADKGVYLSDLTRGNDLTVTLKRADPRASYKVRVHGGYVGEPSEKRKIFNLKNHWTQHLGSYKFNRPAEDPSTVELMLDPKPGRVQHVLSVHENYEGFHTAALNKAINSRYKQIAIGKLPVWGKEPWVSLWVDWVEFEGPYYPEQTSELEGIMFPNGRTQGAKPKVMWDKHAKQMIRKFAFEAFRHKQPASEYIERVYQYFLSTRKSGANYLDSMAEAFSVILSSPEFLYIVEPSQQEVGKSTLDNRELAVRLAYFLWSSPPDGKLYAADLQSPQVLEKQVERMLADARSKEFRDGFIEQWADLHRYDAITIDRKLYKEFNSGIEFAAKQEVKEFFGVLLDENLPAKNLIDSDFVTIDHALVEHYGLPSLEDLNQSFTKVELPEGSARGGLTTQAAFLMLGSNGERSSPVIRGAFLQEKLLHDKPLPPPPNVPELGTSTDEPLTNRQLVKLHQRQKVCSSCHHKMDAIGFGLENFDAIGAWRETEMVKGKQVPVDPASRLPSGESFSNVQGLKALLMDDHELLARELVCSMLSYALGRTIQFSDHDDVDAILEQLEGGDFRVADMVFAVAQSELFRHK